MKIIYKNKIQCLMCNDIIESVHRHNYVTCTCGNVAVDGGQAYWKVCHKTTKYKRIWEDTLGVVHEGPQDDE